MQLSEWEEIFRLNFTGLWPWFTQASRLREERNGTGVSLCVILNAKSGLCQQDCAFCAQSRRSRAAIQKYPLLPQKELVAAAQQAAAAGGGAFQHRHFRPGGYEPGGARDDSGGGGGNPPHHEDTGLRLPGNSGGRFFTGPGRGRSAPLSP